MRKGIIGIKVKFDHKAIVDQDVNNIEQLDNILKDVKRKLK